MFQADSEQLEQIARLFAEQADVADEMLQLLARIEEALEGGGWIGRGAEHFYEIMGSEVFPSLKKLSDYMSRSSETAKMTAQKIEEQTAYILSKCRRG